MAKVGTTIALFPVTEKRLKATIARQHCPIAIDYRSGLRQDLNQQVGIFYRLFQSKHTLRLLQ